MRDYLSTTERRFYLFARHPLAVTALRPRCLCMLIWYIFIYNSMNIMVYGIQGYIGKYLYIYITI